MKIEKLVFGGQGLGHIDNKAIFLWNTLPDEEVSFEYTNHKKNFAEGIATKILTPSPYRINPKEDHYLSCSPLQIIDWEKENVFKKDIAIETYKKIGGLDASSIKIFKDNQDFNYRNKIEYNFHEKNNKISFAVFKPQTNDKIPIDICELARPEINNIAKYILNWVNTSCIKNDELNKIILRCNQKGKVLAGLLLNSNIQLKSYPEINNDFIGFQVYFAKGNNISVIYKSGRDYLEEELFETKLRYGLFSFFQVNVNLFKETLKDISSFIKKEDNIIDYYSGVGAIGLPLRNLCKKLCLIENNPEAFSYAKTNITLNNFKEVEIKSISAEKSLNLISHDKTIIFDPPRSGLNKKIIETLLKEKPEKIIYLSCNLSTQARDISALLPYYKIKFIKLYNYFPRTPHIEGLCVLNVK